MAQLCFWTKIRTKQWLVLGASAFQCMRAGFVCVKCDNFACRLTRQDQNELHLKRWFFFLAKIGIFCKSIAGPLVQAYIQSSKWAWSEKMIFFAKIGIFCKSIAGPLSEAYTQPYSFGGRIKLLIYQIRHELSLTIHEISTIWKKNVRWRTL